jgi:structural maintenance of chromosome 4
MPPKITRAKHPHTGERMVIEKIVCENFKSCGGLKEMGVFHKSFSAIIGPNGNGKSNIIDAMLFIHNSELLPNLKSCAVTVHFLKILDEGEKDQDD